MTEPALSEADLAAILERADISLGPDEVRDVFPGAVLMQRLVDRVNAPLPREAEPAVTFASERGR